MIGQMSYIALLLAMCSLPATAQVSSENYVQTTERISNTQSLSTTQYYDGLGRPTVKVAQGVTPQKENLVTLQEYDGLGRENNSWLPVTSSSAYLNASDIASQSQRLYGDSRGYNTTVYDGSPLNRVSRLEGEGEAWSGHPVKTEYLVNSSSFPLNSKYYRGNLDGYALYGANITSKSLLLVNYYDDYAFLNKCDATSKQNLGLNVSLSLESAFPSNAAPNAKGYQTGKKAYLTDGSNRYVLSSMYYGLKGRVVQSHSTNLLGGFEHTYTSYTYAGSPLQSKHIHTAGGKRTLQEDYAYEYDHAGRLTKTSYSVNGSTKRTLSTIVYDDYGRIKSQTLLGKESVNHEYNLRSWPLSISSSHFTQKLAYNTPNNGLFPEKALYNGNIAAMSWQSANKAVQGYQLEYNNQSMLTDANYGEGQSLGSNKERYDEHLSYDKMGNIQMLLRYGLRDDNKYGLIDNLDYTYNGNQLTKVDDALKGPYYAGAFHFVDGARASVEYTYDANGNMVKDLNKGISTIQYDINNRLQTISYSDGRRASYVYDAEGRKLSVSYNLTAMISTQPQLAVMQSQNAVSANATNGQTTINYCDNIIYDGDETVVLNPVGYALYDKSGNLSFHYYLKDHLGDNRVVMSENGTVEQVNDYYPTGALMGSSTGGDKQHYKYNGKELDRFNGLDWYDYGARFYDAAILRWNGVDKLCEKYIPYSEYGYCKNNFINTIDIDGMRIVVWYKISNGSTQCFIFNGTVGKLPNSQFVKDFIAAYLYNTKNGGGKAMLKAAKEDYDYNLVSANEELRGTFYQNNGRKDKSVVWESRKGLLLSNGKRQSPATKLEHEFDHYVDDVSNHKAHKEREAEADKQFENKEERRVIKGNETLTAMRNGEGTRNNHKGKSIYVSSPVSIY